MEKAEAKYIVNGFVMYAGKALTSEQILRKGYYCAPAGHVCQSAAAPLATERVVTLEDGTPVDDLYLRNLKRQELYPQIADLTVALWESVVEGRGDAVAAIQAIREQVKSEIASPGMTAPTAV